MIRILFFIYFTAVSFSLHGSSLERTFYAIFSLQCLLDETELSATQEEYQALWTKALSHDPLKHYVQAAFIAYQDGNFSHSSHLLKKVWKNARKMMQYASPSKSVIKSYPHFDGNHLFTDTMRIRLRKHLLPFNHPCKIPLDHIFCHGRPTFNANSLLSVGFNIICSQANSYIKVVRHPALDGYLLKLYLDDEERKKLNIPGWLWLVQRCEGAENIRRLIKEKNLRYFKVPHKWLYPLPPDRSSKKDIFLQQPVVLLVEDMQLVTGHESRVAWKYKITKEHLEELFCVISHGYGSAALVHNVPLCKDGQFAFVDTEYPKRKSKYHHAKIYLSHEMADYWDQLIRSGGPN